MYGIICMEKNFPNKTSDCAQCKLFFHFFLFVRYNKTFVIETVVSRNLLSIELIILLICSFQERLRKLESERGALHMELSVLSEQVDAQSNKIQELENMLQEKKDTLRQMEEALQKARCFVTL